jgi:hypothetical protein
MESEPFKTPHVTFTRECSPSNESRTSATYATERAKILFGCYRRGEANDPDTYVAAVAAVLQHYAPEIIKAVTDPYGGLPGRKSEQGWAGLPDVADVKEACEAEAVRQERLAAYARMPRVHHRRIEAPPEEPGARANIFVPADNRHYGEMVERAQKEDAVWWRYGVSPSTGASGIWVPLGWTDGWRRGHGA